MNKFNTIPLQYTAEVFDSYDDYSDMNRTELKSQMTDLEKKKKALIREYKDTKADGGSTYIIKEEIDRIDDHIDRIKSHLRTG